MIRGSPAWKPQAMFAWEIKGTRSSSGPCRGSQINWQEGICVCTYASEVPVPLAEVDVDERLVLDWTHCGSVWSNSVGAA